VLARLKELELDNVLIVVEEVDENLYLAARNLRNIDVIDVQGVNPVNLIGFDKVLFTVGALKKAEELLS
jgi:large subunit ribosomal protein L4